MKNAKPCAVVKDLFFEMEEERKGQLIDLEQLRRMQDWSVLNQQIVGAENP